MADQPSRADRLEEQFPGKYLSLTSYKRDGTAVATPVWFVIDDRTTPGHDRPRVIQSQANPAQPGRDHRAVHGYRAAARRSGPRTGRAASRQRTRAPRSTHGTQIQLACASPVSLDDQTLQRLRRKPGREANGRPSDHPAAPQWARSGRHDNHLALDAAATGDRPRRWWPCPTDGLVLGRVFAP